MAETIARAHIVRSGLAFNDQPVQEGTSFEFQRGTFTTGNRSIEIHPPTGENGLVANSKEFRHVRLLPGAFSQIHEPNEYNEGYTETTCWGHDPNKPSTQEFGAPDASLRVDFLGNPLGREILEPVMDGTRAQDEPFTDGKAHAQLLFVSPTFHAENISGLTDTTQDYTCFGTKIDGFSGEYMVGAYRREAPRYRVDEVVLFVATRADTDRLMRIRTRTKEVQSYPSQRKANEARLDALANVSAYVQTADSPLLAPDHTLHLPALDFVAHTVDCAGWDRGIPQMWEGIAESLGGFNWDKISASIPSRVATSERTRLAPVYAIKQKSH